MNKKSLISQDQNKEEDLYSQKMEEEIMKLMKKRKEENNALKKILNNLNTPQGEGKNKK